MDRHMHRNHRMDKNCWAFLGYEEESGVSSELFLDLPVEYRVPNETTMVIRSRA